MRAYLGPRKGITAVNVKDLCLGALTFGDASGYGLKKFFETTFNQFCSAGFGSIYPALAELAAEGLVSCTGEAQNGRPDRKIYHLTATGHNAFVNNLLQASPTHRVKSDFLLVMYFGHLLPAGRLEAFIDGRISELNRQIEFLEDYRATAKTRTLSSKLVREYGLTVMMAARDYLRHHRDEIISSAAPPQTTTSQCRKAAPQAGAQSS